MHAQARRMLGDLHEAEDVAQEAFMRLWKQAARWRPEARVGTWLHTVVSNLCVDRLRKRRESALEDLPEPVDPAQNPLAERQRAELGAAIEAAMAQLPPRQKAAVVLVHHQGFSGREAAAALGVSEEAVESLLARGRRALRKSLARHRDELLGEG
ncbi:putative ECF subfamily RNA polymerase sigma-24 factor [Magnetofaba australis IT-1]|uniref:Putative ECF subfamily RNA polymerase sigma-24 factor n=1 Tax=Magnetofaba australis IT-1 TaxID=1434232 RepID=A0A1Y2K036_9PROT|nr:putative ECF subfamily RNA polymerase sigma-24 factor [Magnetofaba australis IT-1]